MKSMRVKSSSSSSSSDNNVSFEDDVKDKETITVTLWGTKVKKRYSCQANIDSSFMPTSNNDINNDNNNNNINNDNYEVSTSSSMNSPNKCIKKTLLESPKTIIIENIEKLNNDGSISLHPIMGEITVKSNSIPFNSIEAIEKYYIIDTDDNNNKGKNETQVSASSSPSSGETTVQSIESVDFVSPPLSSSLLLPLQPQQERPTQPTPLPTKPSNQVVTTSGAFWENIDSQNFFIPYNKKLFESSLDSFSCGGDYDMLIKAQDKIKTDNDDILRPILTPNIACVNQLQQLSNEDKMDFFYKRLVSCVLVPKSNRTEIRELGKVSKIVDVKSLSENHQDPEHILKVWPLTNQLKSTGNNIHNDIMKKIIRKRTHSEIFKVGIIRTPDENMTSSETRKFEDDAEKNKEDDEISTLLRSNVQDLKKIETDLNTRIMKLKRTLACDVPDEAKLIKIKRDKDKLVLSKYQKMKSKTNK